MSIATIKQLKQKIADARKEMQLMGREALHSAFADFLAAVPEAKAIVWAQYTPYFNDGDSCVFGVNDLCLKLTKQAYRDLKCQDYEEMDEDSEDEDEVDFDDYYECDSYSFPREGSVPRADEIGALFTEFVNGVSDNDLFLAVFGDHVQVKATRSGFETEECDHD